MSADFDFSEVDALVGALGVAAAKIVPLTESKVLTQVAVEVRAVAVAAAPVRSGDLRSSIYIRGGKGYRIVGSDLKQGFFQEHGTSAHPPQPWLYPAGDKGGERMAELLEKIADPLP